MLWNLFAAKLFLENVIFEGGLQISGARSDVIIRYLCVTISALLSNVGQFLALKVLRSF
jgi:hypothetical protein